MDFLLDYAMFLLKAITVVLAVGAVVLMIVVAAVKPKAKKGELVFDDLSAEHQDLVSGLKQSMLDKKAFKLWQKSQKDQPEHPHKLFVLDFHGSMDAHEVEALREEITAVLAVATQGG